MDSSHYWRNTSGWVDELVGMATIPHTSAHHPSHTVSIIPKDSITVYSPQSLVVANLDLLNVDLSINLLTVYMRSGVCPFYHGLPHCSHRIPVFVTRYNICRCQPSCYRTLLGQSNSGCKIVLLCGHSWHLSHCTGAMLGPFVYIQLVWGITHLYVGPVGVHILFN